ncbi:MAG: TolC family protein [Sphingobacteriales bacterium]|nr:TolC family protein [Sphingobacteriales bacterium]MBI3718793.1 TolC family protein [Sphingobacteriales bacterium]
MGTKKSILLLVVLIGLSFSVLAQDNKWDLKKCVEYAMNNAIPVKQSTIQSKFAELNYLQSKRGKEPNVNFSNNTGYNFGRSIDPSTNQFTNTQLIFQQYNLNANVTIFNWNSIKNNILASKYELDASKADLNKARNDIALTVATNFLQTLLAKEQANITTVQVGQTMAQLGVTRRKVTAGSLPELNALELEAQLARDSSALIAAQTNAELNLLQLKSSMNMDAALPFDIYVPFVDKIPVISLAELQPDVVYASAMQTQPAQKANEIRLKSLNAALKSARATRNPTISGFGGLTTIFSGSNQEFRGVTFNGYNSPNPANGAVNVNGVLTPVQSPDVTIIIGKKSFYQQWTGWGTQLDRNFRQNIGLAVNVPLFNGGQVRNSIARAKLNLENLAVTKEQADNKLKQDIYQAYQAATAALQKFNANKRTVDVAQRTYDLTVKRYELGLLTTLDLITNQNNLLKAKMDLVNSQYDYIFKMKILEFYKGNGIVLE